MPSALIAQKIRAVVRSMLNIFHPDALGIQIPAEISPDLFQIPGGCSSEQYRAADEADWLWKHRNLPIKEWIGEMNSKN